MDTDDDVSTLEEEEASLSDSFLSHCSLQEFEGKEEDFSDLPIHNDSKSYIFSPDDNGSIKFQVMCAHTEESDSQKFVMYTIVVERGDDNRPAILERRYSDFLSLFSSLRQSHPALLNQTSFPRKILLGNFKLGVIEKRSNSFETFLHFIYSKDVLKGSEPFNGFLYRRETQESSNCLLHSRYEDAIPLLENLYWLLHKLRGDRDHLLKVLLQLIVCLHAVGNYELSHDYCLLALPRFDGREIEGNCLAKDLYVPFLHFCIRLWWMLGRSRSLFDDRIQKEKDSGVRIDAFPELLDALRDEISLPALHHL